MNPFSPPGPPRETAVNLMIGGLLLPVFLPLLAWNQVLGTAGVAPARPARAVARPRTRRAKPKA